MHIQMDSNSFMNKWKLTRNRGKLSSIFSFLFLTLVKVYCIPNIIATSDYIIHAVHF